MARTLKAPPADFLQPLLLLAAIAAGVAFHFLVPAAAPAFELAVLPLILGMLFAAFLLIPLGHLRLGLRRLRFAALVLAVNYLLTPLYAWTLGSLFLGAVPPLLVGLFIALVTPCTDWYLIFTGMARGDVPLCASILPLNLLLQLLLLPAYLFAFAGAVIRLEPGLLLGIIGAVFTTLLAAQAARRLLERLKGSHWLGERLEPKIRHTPTLMLSLAVVAIFAAWSGTLAERPLVLLLLLAPLALFYVSLFSAGHLLGRALRFSPHESACIANTVTARNSPTVLPIAVVAFPEAPLVALSQAIITMVEIPVLLGLNSALLLLTARRRGGKP